VPGFRPESELEQRLAETPEMHEGLAWGKPRPGHPEGTIGAHVSQLLRRLDDWGAEGEERARLRFIALVHDTCKRWVDQDRPKTGENHHAMRARRLAERFTDDEAVLAVIEQHDRPYQIWRRERRTGEPQDAAAERMLARVPDHALFLRFVELDTSTEAKDPGPIAWLRERIERAGREPRA
jgi:hypothetical protein